MHVTLVQVRVKPDRIEDFIEATRANHLDSIQEPGNRRFDVLQDGEDETRFLLYEAYDTPQDAAAHKTTGHYLTWREQVADMMAQPRQGISYRAIFPHAPS